MNRFFCLKENGCLLKVVWCVQTPGLFVQTLDLSFHILRTTDLNMDTV